MLLKSLLLLNFFRTSSNCPAQNTAPACCSVAAKVFPASASVNGTNRSTVQANNCCKCANCNNCCNCN